MRGDLSEYILYKNLVNVRFQRNSLKSSPPAVMQTSHLRDRVTLTFAKTLGSFRISLSTMAILSTRSVLVSMEPSQIQLFMQPQRKKSNMRDQVILMAKLWSHIYQSIILVTFYLRNFTLKMKCAGAPPCWNHILNPIEVRIGRIRSGSIFRQNV